MRADKIPFGADRVEELFAELTEVEDAGRANKATMKNETKVVNGVGPVPNLTMMTAAGTTEAEHLAPQLSSNTNPRPRGGGANAQRGRPNPRAPIISDHASKTQPLNLNDTEYPHVLDRCLWP